MQAESDRSKVSAGAIVAIVAGVALVIGPLLTWASFSLDFSGIAERLGIDPSLLQSVNASKSVNGFDQDLHGWITLAGGVVVIVGAVIAIAQSNLRRPMGALVAVAGLIGGGAAVYDAWKINDFKSDALASLGPSLGGTGIDLGEFGDAIHLSAGVGLWIALVAGVVAIIAGIILAMSGERSSLSGSGVSTTAVATGGGTGFEPPGAPVTPTPQPPSTPTAPTPPAPAQEHVQPPAPRVVQPDQGSSGTEEDPGPGGGPATG